MKERRERERERDGKRKRARKRQTEIEINGKSTTEIFPALKKNKIKNKQNPIAETQTHIPSLQLKATHKCFLFFYILSIFLSPCLLFSTRWKLFGDYQLKTYFGHSPARTSSFLCD